LKINVVNWKMISHPMNWLIILLMLIIAGGIGHYLLTLAGITPDTGDDSLPLVAGGQLPSSYVPTFT
jgi:hypothetical protein